MKIFLDTANVEGIRQLVNELVSAEVTSLNARNYGFPTQVIVASVHHPKHVIQAALIGAHIVTLPFRVLEQMFKHLLTGIGLERFLTDWKAFEERLKP